MDDEGQGEITKVSMISTSALTSASDLLLFQSSVCPLSKARSSLTPTTHKKKKIRVIRHILEVEYFGLKIKAKSVGVRTKHTYWEDT